MRFCIDSSSILLSNSLPEAQQKYPKNVFKGLWDRIENEVSKNNIVSVEFCKAELLKKDDEIAQWIKNESFKNFFKKIDEQCLDETQRIIKAYPNLLKKGLSDGEADPYLVAFAKINNLILVTEENFVFGSPTKIKIPNVCKSENVQCTNLLGLIREYGWSF